LRAYATRQVCRKITAGKNGFLTDFAKLLLVALWGAGQAGTLWCSLIKTVYSKAGKRKMAQRIANKQHATFPENIEHLLCFTIYME
jgi:hypothetical protein